MTFVSSKDDGQCPPAPFRISGNTAKAVDTKLCYKRNGEVIRFVSANGTLSGNGLKISVRVDSVGVRPARIDVILRCAR